jgi:hypothetical protein
VSNRATIVRWNNLFFLPATAKRVAIPALLLQVNDTRRLRSDRFKRPTCRLRVPGAAKWQKVRRPDSGPHWPRVGRLSERPSLENQLS